MDMFERRRVDIRCLQEIRYRGQGTRVKGGDMVERIKRRQKRSSNHLERGDIIEDVIEVKRLNEIMIKIAMVCGIKLTCLFCIDSATG